MTTKRRARIVFRMLALFAFFLSCAFGAVEIPDDYALCRVWVLRDGGKPVVIIGKERYAGLGELFEQKLAILAREVDVDSALSGPKVFVDIGLKVRRDDPIVGELLSRFVAAGFSYYCIYPFSGEMPPP